MSNNALIPVVADLPRIFEEMRQGLIKAKTTDEAKRIFVGIVGLAAAARQAGDRKIQAETAVLEMEAVRRLGQLMAAQEKTVGFSVGTKGSSVKGARVDDKPTLAEAGIGKNLAHRARTARAMSEEGFQEAVRAKREAILHRPPRRRTRKQKEPQVKQAVPEPSRPNGGDPDSAASAARMTAGAAQAGMEPAEDTSEAQPTGGTPEPAVNNTPTEPVSEPEAGPTVAEADRSTEPNVIRALITLQAASKTGHSDDYGRQLADRGDILIPTIIGFLKRLACDADEFRKRGRGRS
jgi:hypothetical protein